MDFAAKRANVPIEVVRGGNVSQEVQRQALSQIKDGSSRTISRAVDKVVKERMQRDYEPTGVIDQILVDDLRRPRKQRHTAQRIFRRLRDEHGLGHCCWTLDIVRAEVQGIRVESVLPCLRARPGGLLEREDVRAVEMQSQDGGGSGWIARKRPRSVPAHPCVRAHADTVIDNRFYVVFPPVVRKSHTCSFKKEATSLPARRQLKTYDYNKGVPPDSSRLGKVFPLTVFIRLDPQNGMPRVFHWSAAEIDGLGAMVGAWRCDEEAKEQAVPMGQLPLMNEIAHYNEVDCKVMMEIVCYLRASH